MSARDEAATRFRDAFPDLKDAVDVSIEDLRAYDDDLWNSLLPDDAIVEPVDAAGVRSLWVSVPGARTDRAVVWFHGGGFTIGSAEGRRAIAAEVSRSSGLRVLVPDYRLAPEDPFPAGLNDAITAFRWVADQIGPESVVLGGDSAGGGLVLSALLSLRDQGLPTAAGAALISPLADWTLSGRTHVTNRDVDEFVTAEMLEKIRPGYVGDADVSDPLVSPVLGDYTDLPPLLIVVGTEETLLDDSRMVAAAGERAGVDVDLRIFGDMFHIWPMFSSILPEAQEAVDVIGAFAAKRAG